MADRFVAVAVVLIIAVAGVAGYLVGTTNLRTTTATTTAVSTAGLTGLTTVTNPATTVTAISTTTVTVLSITTAATRSYDGVGIVLGVSANSSVVGGQNLTIIIALANELSYPVNATFSGFPYLPQGPSFSMPSVENFLLPIPPYCGYAPNGYIPYFVAIYNQSGIPLQLNTYPPELASCLTVGTNHVFGTFQVITESIRLAGFWTSPNESQPWINATFHQFSPGPYTIVAFDPWNQIAETSFTVTT